MVHQDMKNKHYGYLLETQSQKWNSNNNLAQEITTIFKNTQTVFILYDWPKTDQKTLVSITQDEPNNERIIIQLTDKSRVRISRFNFCQHSHLIVNQDDKFIKNDRLIDFYKNLPTYIPRQSLSNLSELSSSEKPKTTPIRQDFEW